MNRRRMMMQDTKMPNYLCFTALEDGTFTFTIPAALSTTDLTSFSYSKDGKHWTTLLNNDSEDVVHTTPTVSNGERLYLKGEALRYNDSSKRFTIDSTGTFDISGNILSLLFGDDFIGKENYVFSNSNNYLFSYLFTAAKVISAENMVIDIYNVPAYGLRGLFSNSNIVLPPSINCSKCYNNSFQNMFTSCTSLTTAPNLAFIKTISLDNSLVFLEGFKSMFEGCTSLKYTTPIDYVYTGKVGSNSAFQNMFRGCTSLEETPILEIRGYVNTPTEFSNSSGFCDSMFYECSNLIKAPRLRAETTKNYSYRNIFYKCSKLNYIVNLVINVSGTNPLQNHAVNVAANGIYVKHINATWTTTGTNGVPAAWTIIYYNPTTNKYYLSDKTTECDDHGNVINA